jgi:hypothetical protein
MLEIEGHAIVSADGMIGDADGTIPPALRNEADWRLYQAALDRAALVVVGRRGHERFPNPGRRRLVLTRRVVRLTPDPADPRATLWNPAHAAFDDVLAALAITQGTIAVTGVFDFFAPRFTHFALSECHRLVLSGGTPCFAAGHPRSILAGLGLRPEAVSILDAAAMVTSTRWTRPGADDADSAATIRSPDN